MIEAVTIFVKLSDLALRKLHPETKQATILHGAIFLCALPSYMQI